MRIEILEFIFKWLVRFLAGVTPKQWEHVKNVVWQALQLMPDSTDEQKKQFVLTELKQVWTDIEPHILNFLIEAAVAFLKAKIN